MHMVYVLVFFLTPEICLNSFSTTTFVTWCFFGQMFVCHVPSLHHAPNSWKYLYTIWYNYWIILHSYQLPRTCEHSVQQYSVVKAENCWSHAPIAALRSAAKKNTLIVLSMASLEFDNTFWVNHIQDLRKTCITTRIHLVFLLICFLKVSVL